MPTDLYTDALAWSGQQSALLRRLAAGERVNDAIDWPNVIEEIADVGKSELRAATSLLSRALEHLIKIIGWPAGPVEHWSSELGIFLADAELALSPSMRSKLDLADLHRRARARITRQTIGGTPPRPLPETCPLTLDDLVPQDKTFPEIETLLTKLAAPPPA